jgi:meiotic recombination protein DMC1
MVGTFRPERIESIATRFGVDGKQALENILVGKALNSEHQQSLIDNLGRTFAEEKGVFRLLVLPLRYS